MSTRHASTGHEPVTLRMPFEPSSVPEARKRLEHWMADQGLDNGPVDDARVVVSELVANSVRHARPLPDGTVLVSWRFDNGSLDLSVTDGGAGTRPMRVNAPMSALAGRGIAIVETLTMRWWAEQTRSRSTVHAVLPV